jgi:hypothetical protein
MAEIIHKELSFKIIGAGSLEHRRVVKTESRNLPQFASFTAESNEQ